MRAKGHRLRDQAEQTQALPQRLGSGVSPPSPPGKAQGLFILLLQNEALHQQLVDNNQES